MHKEKPEGNTDSDIWLHAAYAGHGATRPIVPILIWSNGVKCPTYALYDTGANCSAIIEPLCHKINAPIKYIDMKLNTFNQNSQSKRPITSFKITNLAETFQLDIENALISNSLSTEGENPPTPEDLHQFEHLKNLTITELENKVSYWMQNIPSIFVLVINMQEALMTL